MSVTVAIPVRNGGALLDGVLSALAAQSRPHELLVCDSGSSDGSAELARARGARVIEISPGEYGHGRTRNLLMREAAGDHVAFLTQDAEPAGEGWLAALMAGFEQAERVALVYGPYVPRPDASAAVRGELNRWFASLSPTGEPVTDRLDPAERERARSLLLGRRGFFSDANACVAKEAWERIPFREIAYAEDRALALDMMCAGYAKVFVPEARVLHSHSYTPLQQLRRSFDEARGLREVYGWREPADPRRLASQLRGELAAARREMHAEQVGRARTAGTLAAVTLDRTMRLAGSVLGSRAELLPAVVRRRASLEGGAGTGAEGPPR